MNVSLTKELDGYVNEKVQSGLYNSASEVIRDGLRLLKERDARREAELARLRAELDIGIEQIENGQYIDVTAEEAPQFVEAIVAEGRRRLAARGAH